MAGPTKTNDDTDPRRKKRVVAYITPATREAIAYLQQLYGKPTISSLIETLLLDAQTTGAQYRHICQRLDELYLLITGHNAALKPDPDPPK